MGIKRPRTTADTAAGQGFEARSLAIQRTIALATTVYVLIAIFQLYVMKLQARTMERTLRLTQKAILTIDAFDLRLADSPELVIHLRNVGKLPAGFA